MNILCVAQVEDDTHILKEIAKQTIQPSRVCIYKDPSPAVGINPRRQRIGRNHQKLKDYVRMYNPDVVWQLEGDAVLPENCLERLLGHYNRLQAPDFGYISGIQVGRHGLYCLGVWKNFTPESFETIDYRLKGVQEVEATGFYCLLAPKDAWLSGNAEWDGQPYGPDVAWGLSMRYKKYVDMGLEIGHQVKRGVIWPHHMSTCNARFYKEADRWKYKQLD